MYNCVIVQHAACTFRLEILQTNQKLLLKLSTFHTITYNQR